MFYTLCLLLITALSWQQVTSRHLVQPNYHSLQQPYYLPYSDYGYTYSGPSPYQPAYHQPYQQPYPQSPLYSPPGTYFDQRRGILRPFPGGGVPVLVDYHKRCSNQYVGLKAHPEQHQYYYVCKPDCVIFGKCQNLQNFNTTSGQCVQNPAPEYIPSCTGVGRYPLFSDCHLYYKCEEDLQPKIYSCPAYMVFSPASKKCISGNKCTPTQISPRSSYIPEYCANKFPPCYENGVFRSPSDCSLYYKCELQKNGVYMQTRLRCPNGNFYDLQKSECLPSDQVPCDCIQVAELVYPKPNSMPYQPALYPAQYDFDSLEENMYPIENSDDKSAEMNINCDISESKRDSKSDSEIENETEPQPKPEPEVLVTAPPPTSSAETTLSAEADEPNDSGAVVLSDYVDIGNDGSKPQSGELEELAKDASATTLSSEETTSLEGSGSGSEDESDEITTPSPEDENTATTQEDAGGIEDAMADVTTEKEEVGATVATTEASEEKPDEPDLLIEEPENKTLKPSKDGENELKTTPDKEQETTTTSTTVFAATHIPANSAEPEPCENLIEGDESNDKPLPTDIHTQDKSQTHTKKCLTKSTTTGLDSEPTKTTLVSEFTRGSRSTLHEQNSTTITTVTPTATTQFATTETTPNSDNLETTQASKDIALDIEKDSLGHEEHESNLLDFETNLETAETMQSSERTTAATKEATHSLLEETETFQDDNRLNEDEEVSNLLDKDADLTTSQTVSKDASPFTKTIHTPSEESTSEEDDVLDISQADSTSSSLQTTTKQSLVESTLLDQSAQVVEESSPDHPQQSTTANIESEATTIPSENKELQETEEKSATDNSTTVTPQTTMSTMRSSNSTLKPASEETTDNLADFDMDDEINLLDSEITIDNFETSTQPAEESIDSNSLENEELIRLSSKENNSSRSIDDKFVTLRHADFSDEEFLPVHSISTLLDEKPDHTPDFSIDYNDETTAATGPEQEETTTRNPNSEETEKQDGGKPITTLKRRQTWPDDTTQLTTVTPPIQITLAADPSDTTTEESTIPKAATNEDDLLALLESEIKLHDHGDEVSNNEITSAEITQTTIETSTVKQQLPHSTHSTTFTPTQTPTTTPHYNQTHTTETTSEPCEKHSDTLVLHVRDEEHPTPSLDSLPPSKSLYYILKTQPVINKNNSLLSNNDNKSCNETVAAPPCVEPDNGQIPRLEIIAERPIDVHFSVCPSTCDKDHKHNYSPTSKRAVFLRWFANKSKQTMGFETVNEVSSEDVKDC